MDLQAHYIKKLLVPTFLVFVLILDVVYGLLKKLPSSFTNPWMVYPGLMAFIFGFLNNFVRLFRAVLEDFFMAQGLQNVGWWSPVMYITLWWLRGCLEHAE